MTKELCHWYNFDIAGKTFFFYLTVIVWNRKWKTKKYVFWKIISFLNKKTLLICLSLERNISSRTKIWSIQYTHTRHSHLFFRNQLAGSKENDSSLTPHQELLTHKDLAKFFWHFLDMSVLHTHNYRSCFERLRTITSEVLDPLILSCPMSPPFLPTFGS